MNSQRSRPRIINNVKDWRMAKMNLAILAISCAGLGERWADTFARDIIL